MCTPPNVFIHFRNVHDYWSNDCKPNRVFLTERMAENVRFPSRRTEGGIPNKCAHFLTLEDGTDRVCSEPSAKNYHFFLRISRLLRGGSLKWRKLRSDLFGVDFAVGAISLVSVDFQAPCASLSHSDKHVNSVSLYLKEFRSAFHEALRHNEAERRGDFRYALFLTELVSKTGLLT